jgi:hypothetical protein
MILTKGVDGYIIRLVSEAEEISDVRSVSCTDDWSVCTPRIPYDPHERLENMIGWRSPYGKNTLAGSWRPPQGSGDELLGRSCHLVWPQCV